VLFDIVQEVVTRISGLLQDMASSPHITAGPTTAVSSSQPGSHHASATSLHAGAPNMRLNFSLMSSGVHTFSNTSLPQINTIGFLSPMVPPSPRSPMSSARSSARASRPTRYRTSSNPSPLLISSLTSSGGPSSTFDGKGALKPPFGKKSYFFGSGNALSAHGIADQEVDHGERLQPIVAPLRTQEIMLFYLATLLRTLATDSYKVQYTPFVIHLSPVNCVIAAKFS
jgi:hypothetical protein